jgi:hypothetical protein
MLAQDCPVIPTATLNSMMAKGGAMDSMLSNTAPSGISPFADVEGPVKGIQYAKPANPLEYLKDVWKLIQPRHAG